MTITTNYTNGHAVIALQGRLDTASAAQTASDVERALASCGTIHKLTCDASQLEYISSSGLRILLSLAKRYKDFRVTEACADVYQVFEMTGFTKIMQVEKALRRLSVDGCELIGVGGVGKVYRLDGDTIIKVFREGTTIDEVQTEIGLSKEAFVLGMPTAISFDVVRVETQYGLVYELLKATTLSATVAQHPEQVDEYARLYADLFRQMHSIRVPQGSSIPRAADREESAVRYISRYFDTQSVDLMLEILSAIPQADRLLHCDLQTKNAMVQNGELMLIDMGELGYGHPIIDLGHAYSAMVTLVGDYQQIIGMPRQLGQDLWARAIDYYFEGLPQDLLEHRKAQIEVVSCVRNFSWLSLSDSFPEAVIRECQELFAERIGKRRDYLLEVSKTFSDWQLK